MKIEGVTPVGAVNKAACFKCPDCNMLVRITYILPTEKEDLYWLVGECVSMCNDERHILVKFTDVLVEPEDLPF